MKTIDVNCDMGEGMDNDIFLMPFISSTNIACGYHAGNTDTMKRMVELALQHNVAIGAHPGFDDKENFGRNEIELPPLQLFDIVAQQIFTLQKICNEFATTIHHIKPHGALYNMAAKYATMSSIIVKAIHEINNDFIVYGLSGSYLISEAAKIGLKTANEVFADRTYQNDGTLTSRKHPNALITDVELSIKQVLQMVQKHCVISVSGNIIGIKADTICIHGDGKHAVTFAKKIAESLKENNIELKAI